jgi:YD repeat-containing protein
MVKVIRRCLLTVAFFVMLGGALLFGGPLTSGGFWLTSRAVADQTPVTSPWLQSYHKGGIDFSTGIYVRTDQDVIVKGGDLPIVLQRSYRSQDQVSRAFGVGATHNGEWYLIGDGERFQWAGLILDDGAHVRYIRTSPGSSFLNAMFAHTSSPTGFYGSRLGWTGLRWALRWYDGSVGIFRACGAAGTDLCSIMELRNPAGLAIQYLRDERTQVLHTIRSGMAEVSLEYDDQRRVIRVRGSDGQEAGYEYDAGGRLVRVAESSGVVRRYTYNARGGMLTIDEPRWHIENSYDSAGRCTHQVTRWPDGRATAVDVTYIVRDGSIVEAIESWNNGPKTIYHFNEEHYLESEDRDPTGPAPVVINYSRNVFSNFSTGVTIRCYDAHGKLRRKAEGHYEGEDATDAMVEKTCRK